MTITSLSYQGKCKFSISFKKLIKINLFVIVNSFLIAEFYYIYVFLGGKNDGQLYFSLSISFHLIWPLFSSFLACFYDFFPKIFVKDPKFPIWQDDSSQSSLNAYPYWYIHKIKLIRHIFHHPEGISPFKCSMSVQK